jgi:hypothetical protein
VAPFESDAAVEIGVQMRAELGGDTARCWRSRRSRSPAAASSCP